MAAPEAYDDQASGDARNSRGHTPANITVIDRRPWVVRVREACKAANLSPTDRLVGIVIASYLDRNGAWSVSVDQLVEDTGLHRASVFRSFRKLTAACILDIESGKRQRRRDRYSAGSRISKMPPAERSGPSHTATAESHGATVESHGATVESQGATRTSHEYHDVSPANSSGTSGIGTMTRRAEQLVNRYRIDLYPKHRGNPYRPSLIREEEDLKAAHRLCELFDDDELEEVVVYFLRVPDKDGTQFVARKTRSLKWCLGLAQRIGDKLKLKGRENDDDQESGHSQGSRSGH